MKFKFFTFHYFGKIFAKDQTKVCVFVHIVSKLTVIPWKIYSVKWIGHRRPIISQFRYRVLKSVIRWVYRMNKMILCASLLLLNWNHIFEISCKGLVQNSIIMIMRISVLTLRRRPSGFHVLTFHNHFDNLWFDDFFAENCGSPK